MSNRGLFAYRVHQVIAKADQAVGMDTAAVADALGIPPGRGRKSLRTCMDQMVNRRTLSRVPGHCPLRFRVGEKNPIWIPPEDRAEHKRKIYANCRRRYHAETRDEFRARVAANEAKGISNRDAIRAAIGNDNVAVADLHKRLSLSQRCITAHLRPALSAASRSGHFIRQIIDGRVFLKVNHDAETATKLQAKWAVTSAERAEARRQKQIADANVRAEARRKSAAERQRKALEREAKKAQPRGEALRRFVHASIRQEEANRTRSIVDGAGRNNAAANAREAMAARHAPPAETLEQFLARGGQVEVLGHNFDNPRLLPGRRPGLPSNF